MEEEATMVTEHVRPSWWLPIVGGIIFIGGGVLYWYLSGLNTPETPPAADTGSAEAGAGVTLSADERTALQDQLDGSLYFSAPSPDKVTGELNFLSTYRYDLDTATIVPVVEEYPFYGMSTFDEEGLVFIHPWKEEGSIDFTHPVYLDFATGEFTYLDTPAKYYEQKLVAADDETQLAFMARNTPIDQDSETWRNIDEWEIVVFNTVTGASTTIPAAANPQWLPGSEVLAYVKTNGVYFYDLNSGKETWVVDIYEDLDIATQLSVSPDGASMILTVPSLGIVDIYTIESADVSNAVVSEYERYMVENHLFMQPVFSPDGQFYAVRSQSSIPAEYAVEGAQIEIRSIDHTEPILEIPVTGIKADADLETWLAEKIIIN